MKIAFKQARIPGQVLCLCALAMTLSGVSSEAYAQPLPAVTANQLQDMIGGNDGRVVVVNFWASWCPPCLEEFPDLIRVYREYHSDGLEVIAVSMNFEDEMEDIEAFLSRFAPPFSVYRATSVDTDFYEGVVENWFGEIPVTLVFDTSGLRVHFYKRLVTYDELSTEVERLLGTPTAP